MPIIEGLQVPDKLEFGNEEHIKIRDQVSKRLSIRKDGLVCPCRETVMTKPTLDEKKGKLAWHCNCGGIFETDRDGKDSLGMVIGEI